MDFGEHPDDAVLRELHEETGLTGERGAVAGIWSGSIPRPLTRPGPLHWVAILYHVRTEPGDLRLEVGGSTDACRWVDLAEVTALARTDLVDGALQALGIPAAGGPG